MAPRCGRCSPATSSPTEVREDELTAQQLGISGVPMFVVDRAFGMSGAQPAEQLQALLEHAWEAGHGVDQPRADTA